MNIIFGIMHECCAFMLAIIAGLAFDLPLKIISCVLFFIFGIIACLLYPIVKHISSPKWIRNWYDYSKSLEPYIAYYIYRLWT